MKWLVYKDVVEGVDYDVVCLIEVWVEINNQDCQFVENNYFGICGCVYCLGFYFDLIEGGICDFVCWYVENLLGVLDLFVDIVYKVMGYVV